jgi:hypothetical protein
MDQKPEEEVPQQCRSALAYIDDMSEWYEDDVEERSRLEYALQILNQIEMQGRLSGAEAAFCAERVREKYG